LLAAQQSPTFPTHFFPGFLGTTFHTNGRGRRPPSLCSLSLSPGWSQSTSSWRT
jgi:hypothetical protein